jgi:hypothetical protein
MTGLRSYPDMEDEERRRFVSIVLDLALAYQRALALFESGTLDQETFRAYRDQFAKIVSTPGGAGFWKDFRTDFPDHVIASVEARIDVGGLSDFLDHAYSVEKSRSDDLAGL